MTAPAPAPVPLQEQSAEDGGVATKKRGLVGFYVATGVALALFVVFCFAWTPLRIWYWEREFCSADASTLLNAHGGWITDSSGIGAEPLMSSAEKIEAAKKLASIGPAARPAVQRAFSSQDCNVRASMLCGIREVGAVWAIPEVVELCGREKGSPLIDMAFELVASLTDYRRKPSGFSPLFGEMLQAEREQLLTWWESEGKAKYGRVDD